MMHVWRQAGGMHEKGWRPADVGQKWTEASKK
jgi:hypothetical protein